MRQCSCLVEKFYTLHFTQKCNIMQSKEMSDIMNNKLFLDFKYLKNGSIDQTV